VLALAWLGLSWFKHDGRRVEKQAIMKSQHTTLLDGRVSLTQSLDGLRASMDSVLLASAVTVKSGDHILDMGCGTGAVGLCVHARLKDLDLVMHGIDIQNHMIDFAKGNARDNDAGNGENYITGDITDKNVYTAEQFNHIIMNPPYYNESERLQSPDPAREKAYSGELSDWIGSANHWLKHGGSLSIIHRADKLDDILCALKGKFGAIEIWPIHSKMNEPAIRVIVKGVRNRKTPLVIHPAVTLFDENGEQSAQAQSILRDGVGFD
jgi:tRNA1(Val) A37 N6-methylase TrmN6